ncbi:unnamed protein product [Ixodes pacificus]
MLHRPMQCKLQECIPRFKCSYGKHHSRKSSQTSAFKSVAFVPLQQRCQVSTCNPCSRRTLNYALHLPKSLCILESNASCLPSPLQLVMLLPSFYRMETFH